MIEEAIPNAKLHNRGLRLEYLTLGWNVAGTVVVIDAAIAAHSVALAALALIRSSRSSHPSLSSGS